MQTVRCRCGKIVCQLDNLPHLPKVDDSVHEPRSPGIVILCRHCKGYVVIQVPAVDSVAYSSAVPAQRAHALTP